MSAFHPTHGRELAGRDDAPHVGRGPRELEFVGVLLAEAMHDVDLLQRLLDRQVAPNRRRHVDGPELRRETAFPDAREVGVEKPVPYLRAVDLFLGLPEIHAREAVLVPEAMTFSCRGAAVEGGSCPRRGAPRGYSEGPVAHRQRPVPP